jgi:hypothetical protein
MLTLCCEITLVKRIQKKSYFNRFCSVKINYSCYHNDTMLVIYVLHVSIVTIKNKFYENEWEIKILQTLTYINSFDSVILISMRSNIEISSFFIKIRSDLCFVYFFLIISICHEISTEKRKRKCEMPVQTNKRTYQ